MNRWVEITFDCLPMRSISRLDAPLDASPKLVEKVKRVKHALETHGTFNTFYVHNARCLFHLTNDESIGLLEFEFEGTIFTNSDDQKTARVDLHVNLLRENCSWLNQQIVDWFAQSVEQAIVIEFDRYIRAGDLQKTRDRIAQMERDMEDQQGFVGMYL